MGSIPILATQNLSTQLKGFFVCERAKFTWLSGCEQKNHSGAAAEGFV
jgi:hypothetical protein